MEVARHALSIPCARAGSGSAPSPHAGSLGDALGRGREEVGELVGNALVAVALEVLTNGTAKPLRVLRVATVVHFLTKSRGFQPDMPGSAPSCSRQSFSRSRRTLAGFVPGEVELGVHAEAAGLALALPRLP